MLYIFVAIISLTTGVALALFVPGNRQRAWATIMTQIVAVVAILLATIPILTGAPSIVGEFQWSFPIDRIGIKVDALGAFFLLFSLPMNLLGTIYALGYLAPSFDKRRIGVHFALLNMLALSYILIYAVENSLVFLLGWEIATLATWLAVIFDYKNQKIRFAGFNYLVASHISLIFLIAALMILHSATNSFDFPMYDKFLKSDVFLRNATVILLLTSFGLKSAYFPLHTWLPRAHAVAPAHISAQMSGVKNNVGIYGILRFTLLLGIPDEWIGWTILIFSTISALMGVLYTVTQRDIKRVLGYSSTENYGIVGIGIGLGYLGLSWHQPTLIALGFIGATLHLLNHAAFKCLLFYAAGAVYRMCHTVDMDRLGGLIKKMPQSSFFFFLGGIAIAALPPLNGLVSEFIIYSGLLSGMAPKGMIPTVEAFTVFIIVATILALVGATSLFSIARIFGLSFLGTGRDSSVECTGEAPFSMRFPMMIHAIFIIILGLVPFAGITLLLSVVEQFLKLAGISSALAIKSQMHKLIMPLGAINLGLISLVFVIFMLRKILLSKGHRRHVTWGCGYTAINSRMQYSGSSFSDQFLSIFRPRLLQMVFKKKLPHGPFPENGFLQTNYPDVVERRIFHILNEGDEIVTKWIYKVADDSRYGLAVGLLTLIILGIWVVAK
ncbi:MAG: hypothetical protein A2504_07330 [Bdellovibrionales bacterium RIFOXYD12_FULL_39_22]|nr:MAG: hypothetical protein A2385_16700 [Bdellovibrionales bacterium RIFOXYB1_FULL_39_21]OFZ44690.1 MAG: hypothetical protein A2485_14560 [Bdellovibrionales bacterium RIFOXYC12_FULL_39_17]OFZ49320.1 MAG: hypothetical protein A2404_08855 [Bdellovibrionales bacterium RIFOXYC1_FULL_39_130]OFZ77056.1 MAG: hypothetical protein A2560_09820 [Bdellovibrionales bacterium RIFOXYD1_FULL_39_84]OFZ95316.1 MAG: hypothetical protein A2504_07330 [Bdellovibrionales bacterium RIFOXYD12_FULL_39_22]HLE13068.1 pr